jgi:surface adhesion protein
VSVPAPATTSYVDAGSVSATISSATGGNFESLAINPAARHGVTDTINATTREPDRERQRGRGRPIVYTASLTSAAQTPVTVTLQQRRDHHDRRRREPAARQRGRAGDDAYVDAGSVSATISTATGGNFESAVDQPGGRATTRSPTRSTRPR